MTKTQAKLLIYKANKFMQKLDGIDSFSITLLYDNSSLMRKEFHQTHNIDCLNDRLFLPHPVNINLLISQIVTLSGTAECFRCWLIYEGKVKIVINGNNFTSFVQSIFREQGTYDLTLFFDITRRVIVVCDNEYDIDIYTTTY
ncbi:TPA: hypothetical protein ACGBQD_005024 [Escherichia coli]|uniref:hypothetical protein n=1 Tax=Escherichia coli TaxID=562 RepID=UPI0014146BC3|nr:hypothetical protein [Escherichia coli]EHU9028732.1 hypothetical protein [Escherichia coli]MBB9062081.1 hypothetical protein [Escherichia coli]MBC1087622.1 hypothetical protein [Escherichia coli]MBS8869482.1 hypothetical protein [Escherichia coli]MDS1616066.1 hypothetical protein [Escherichia coli]